MHVRAISFHTAKDSVYALVIYGTIVVSRCVLGILSTIRLVYTISSRRSYIYAVDLYRNDNPN